MYRKAKADIKAKIKDIFRGGCADDDETMAAIKKCRDDFGYVIDTHTAVAIGVYEVLRQTDFANLKTAGQLTRFSWEE